jgi:glyoxylase-like metal-dependent hydrolase (beta-lactamase superfamily II)
MTQEILPNLYQIEIPLPNSPLKAVNSYFIRGNSRSLLIDTAMNREECLKVADAAFKELRVDPDKLDLFITHLHADHIGLAGVLAGKSSKIYFNTEELDMFKNFFDPNRASYQARLKFFSSNGFPDVVMEEAMLKHPGHKYGGRSDLNFTPAKDGDMIEVGDFSLRAVGTTGHSPGHLCLYEAKKKILFSGDHILLDITPNITLWQITADPLDLFLKNLDKLYNLDIALVLPGHGKIFKDHRKRIDEIRVHHRDRLLETLATLKDGPRTAYEVAPLLTWDIPIKRWEDFPAQQKWFAFGETMSHLRYLECQGRAMTGKRRDLIVYSLP